MLAVGGMSAIAACPEVYHVVDASMLPDCACYCKTCFGLCVLTPLHGWIE